MMDSSQVTDAPARRSNWIKPHENVGEKLNELAITRVVRITSTEPSDKVIGMLWLDTGASGSSSTLVSVTTKTGDYTATDTDFIILCDASGGSFTITLPTAVGRKGRQFIIKKIDSSGNTVTIDGDGSETIDESTTVVISIQNESKTVAADGTEYWII